MQFMRDFVSVFVNGLDRPNLKGNIAVQSRFMKIRLARAYQAIQLLDIILLANQEPATYGK
jgi:hypothetical protein